MHYFCKNVMKPGAECGAKLDALDAACKACAAPMPAVILPPAPALPSLGSVDPEADDDAATAVESPVAKKKHK